MSESIDAADIQLETDGLGAAVAMRLLARRAAHMARDRTPAAPGLAVMLWTIGPERFALPLMDVGLVLPAGRATPVPGAPPALVGLAVRRGKLMNIVDPTMALGLGASGADTAHLLVLRGTHPRLALRVDRAEGVATLESGDDGASETISRQAMLADGGRLLLVNKGRLVEALGLGGQQKGM